MNDMDNAVRYIEFRLDLESSANLRQIVKDVFGIGYPVLYCDHVTLAYGPRQVSEFDSGLIGRKAELVAWNIICDDKAAALEIAREDLEGLGVNNEYPHVTLACASGVKPVYSNELIAGFYSGTGDADAIQLENPVRLSGTVRAVR